MIIYHTCGSLNDLQKCRKVAPSVKHGLAWIPRKMCRHDEPYIIDNGVYGAAKRDEDWEPDPFIDRLIEVEEKMPRDPDWVVLPDAFKDGIVSLVRSGYYADTVAEFGYDYYLPVQDGLPVEDSVRSAKELGAAGIFIGGSQRFKLQKADQFVMTAHDYDLKAHIGRPGPVLTWVRDHGADSMDSSSIVRNGYWKRLRKLEGAQPTEEVKLTEVANG